MGLNPRFGVGMIDSDDIRREVRSAIGFGPGFGASFRGLGYMLEHRSLWRYAIWPTALNVAITLAVFAGLVVAAVGVLAWRLADGLPSGWWPITLELLIAGALLIGVLSLTLVVGWLLQGILLGYFYSKLALRVEQELGIGDEELGEVPLKIEIIDTLIDTALLLLVLGGFLVLQLIPVIGTLVGLAGWLYGNWYILGRDTLDHPLNLRGQRRAERRGFARRHKGAVLGLGCIVFLLTLVPIAGAMMQTTAVVGAVLLHRELRDEEAA